MKFSNLRSAGCELANRLESYRENENVVVIAPVLGGVPVAAEVAKRLSAPLDFVIIRRLLAPEGPGSQLCAVNVGGSLVVDEELTLRLAAPETSSAFDCFVADAVDELSRRERICRGARPPINLFDKTIILVDCGVRTGLTMRAAVRAIRTKHPARIIVAVPVAAPESRETLESMADELICLAWPKPFGNAGVWYADFGRPGDNEISKLLNPDVLQVLND